MLGIDEDRRVFYEGPSNIGIAIWPSPFVSVATPIRTDQDLNSIPVQTSVGQASLVFREDHFDPVTRIRRGRFYNRAGATQPQMWSVQAHPALPSDSRSVGAGGLIKKLVFSSFDFSARVNFKDLIAVGSVALGVQGAMTLWRVIAIEQISTGEDLVTLKARSNLGVIPEISGARGWSGSVIMAAIERFAAGLLSGIRPGGETLVFATEYFPTAPCERCSARPISRIGISLDANWMICLSLAIEILGFDIGGGSCVIDETPRFLRPTNAHAYRIL